MRSSAFGPTWRVFVAWILSFSACAPASGPNTGGTAGGADLAMNSAPADFSVPAVSPDLMMATGSLPFVVDDRYVASGFMGDTGDIVMIPAKLGDNTDCNAQRSSATARGTCHQVKYTPLGASKWAGVFWQSPANNWGDKPGYSIPGGATKVTFQARGAKGGEKVSFQVGGITGKAYQDGLKASLVVTLTPTWAPYSIDISSQAYGQVLGGFCWTMAAADAGAAANFFIDDIRWQ
jgi:hypothetical protein